MIGVDPRRSDDWTARLPPMMPLGQLIAARRRELGRSQRDLADLLCLITGHPTVTRNEISRYEREARIPTPTSLESLAAALDLDADELRWAAKLSRCRRRAEAARTTIEVVPGLLIDATSGPRPMLLIGVPASD